MNVRIGTPKRNKCKMVNTKLDTKSSLNNEKIKKELEILESKKKELQKLLPKKVRRKPLPQSMNDGEFKLLLKNLGKNKKFKETKIAFLLGYESGLRISEIKNLKKEHINIQAKRIFVEKGKFSKDRVVPLPKTWKNYMLDHIPIKKGIRALQRNFKLAKEKAGLDSKFHFHCLRHSFATNLLERGMPINQVQLLMGHSSIAATNIYVLANPKDALAKYEEVF